MSGLTVLHDRLRTSDTVLQRDDTNNDNGENYVTTNGKLRRHGERGWAANPYIRKEGD
jgi:hypothetical protein